MGNITKDIEDINVTKLFSEEKYFGADCGIFPISNGWPSTKKKYILYKTNIIIIDNNNTL